MSDTRIPPDRASLDERPTHRPSESFWPYAELSEQPTDEELAALDPDLAEALFEQAERPFSVTLSFPRFESDDYERAVELAKASAEYRSVGEGPVSDIVPASIRLTSTRSTRFIRSSGRQTIARS